MPELLFDAAKHELPSSNGAISQHDLIVENVVKQFGKYFECFTEVNGKCDYRGSYKDVRCDVLLYHEMNGYLFGIEVKPFKELNLGWLKESFDQMCSYNNTAFPLPGLLSKPRHPNAFFHFSPLLDWNNALQEKKLQDMMSLLPEGLGLVKMNMDYLELRLTSGQRIWSNHTGFSPQVDQLLAPQVGSQRVQHEVVAYRGRSGNYKLASQSAQNRCHDVL